MLTESRLKKEREKSPKIYDQVLFICIKLERDTKWFLNIHQATVKQTLKKEKIWFCRYSPQKWASN